MLNKKLLAFVLLVVLLSGYFVAYKDALLESFGQQTIVVEYVQNITYMPIYIQNTTYIQNLTIVPNITYLQNTTYIYNITYIHDSNNDNNSLPPRIDHLVVSAADSDTSADWQDDDQKLRIVTLMYQPTSIEILQHIRRLVGSIHDFEHEQIRVTVFGYNVSEDFYLEIRTFSYLRWITIPTSEAGTEESALAYVTKTSEALYSKFIYVRLADHLQLKASGLPEEVNKLAGSGDISFTNADSTVNNAVFGFVRGDGAGSLQIPMDSFFSTELSEEHGRCSLFRNLTSPFRTRLVYVQDNQNFQNKEQRHHPDDRLVCLAIATYSGSTPISVDDFSLLRFVLPTFLTTTAQEDTPTTRYRFAMYLGVQRDPFYDDPVKFEDLKGKLLNATKDRSFSLRVFFTPLNAPALDITYKWNVLIDQSYRDGCDYIYQYSDDSEFVTPWVDPFVRYMEAESNFGVVGAKDMSNANTMTLSFAHRNHISILGSYWPSHLKNWWSDDWAQNVYGQRYTLYSKEIFIRNTQNQGQRYPACGAHGALYNKLMEGESRPKILEWLKKQPPTYDIRQKIYYFEIEKANGAK